MQLMDKKLQNNGTQVLALIANTFSEVHLTGWKTSADFPDTLFEGTPQDESSDPCVVLYSALKEVDAQFAGKASAIGEHPIHFVVPVTERNGCKVESEFRKFFLTNGYRSNIFLDIIAIETNMQSTDAGVRVRVPSWKSIETKVKSLTTHKNFDKNHKMDTVLQEYSGWIKNLLQGLQINDMILLDDTTVTVQHRSTIGAENEKRKDKRLTTSEENDTQTTTLRETEARSPTPEKKHTHLNKNTSGKRNAPLTTSEKITGTRAVSGVRMVRQISSAHLILPYPSAEQPKNNSIDGADAASSDIKRRHGRSSHISTTADSVTFSTQDVPETKRTGKKIAEMLARILFQSDTAQDAQNASLHDELNDVPVEAMLRMNSTLSSTDIDEEIDNEVAALHKYSAPSCQIVDDYLRSHKDLATNARSSHRLFQKSIPRENAPSEFQIEDAISSGIRWKRFFVPLLISIILLALILIFVLLCCLYLMRAEREHVPSGRSIAGAEKSPLIAQRSSGKQGPALPELSAEEKIEAIKLTSQEEAGDGAPPKELNTANFCPIFISRRAADQRKILERGPKVGNKPLSSTAEIGTGLKENAISMSEDTPGTDYPSVQPTHINTDHMF